MPATVAKQLSKRAVSQKKGKSALTNTPTLLRADMRFLWARRFKDVLDLHLNSDLAGQASEAEKAILRRATTLIVECERMETMFAQAGGASLQQLEVFQRCSNTLRRLLQSVGPQRRPKEVEDLQTYIRRRYPNRSVDDEAEDADLIE
jgi:hypothetical protein